MCELVVSTPSAKRRRHDVPLNQVRQMAKEAACVARQKALQDIKKLMASKKELLTGGLNALQSYRARAVQSCLYQMVQNKVGMMEASKYAARGNMFSDRWGARLVRRWTREWVKSRTLPQSERGRHAKIASLLSDPTVRAAVRAYLRSEKWSQDPHKLKCLLHNELAPSEASNYTQVIISDEMPKGLKHYMENSVLPRLQLKPGRHGLSLSTMRRLMLTQAHDGKKWSWLLNGESPIKKKGAGRGLHQSDFICSTFGWLSDASITLEYGKNHDGFWNGELFCKQLVDKFFPAFKKAHGDGYVAVVLVDNSQGHSCYAEDALRVSQMNFHPGGTQARMRNGWYVKDGQKVIQPMVYPADHPEYPDKPKGMKTVLMERGLWRSSLRMKCKEHCDYSFETLRQNMPKALQSVPVELIRKWEHRSWRFIDAYAEGLGARDAQTKVKQFSSRTYKSHRRIPEQLARAMDA
ncbi:hypothetical protein L226DRAFT_451296 [Lentinus tigrinus ALCF2SS1-7]|uniref:DDE-1 domain-containing protein n=1 Tax=Lentinus tigrinus ALCF2SS1-6 TaxID=1328759 RepID=A0A5C2SDF6_9APHY|nr:hypothetical protein L227DRAFT_500764 [Lentinus tigrinus ALCF2SS1-6]RPD75240.1 hypothetical protein L226DRAFT_462677 [Lentinus tigrinus ALCF2SS1-7]RPD81641.1 hypothetical protein L226DRAFT_451296 [Lentinus tigrinus ALCF2SS1-7]